MAQDDLQNTITVKTKDGKFKLLKDGQLEDLPENDLMVRPDGLTAHGQVKVGKFKKAAANFYFSVEDEEEAKKDLSPQVKIKNQQIRQFIDETVDRIISEAGVPESSQLKSVIVSRLRDVRSIAETKEALGRLQIAKEKIEAMIGLAEKYKAEVEKAVREGIITERKAVSSQVNDRAGADLSAGGRVGGAGRKPKAGFTEVKYGADERLAGEAAAHRTVGAVDEIRELALVDFRRFGKNPEDAAQKVMDKISLLEDESLLKKAAGIKAWQESEVGRLYLAIGAEALTRTKSVEKAIQERKAKGEKYLTPKEFDAVADLNRKLSY